MLANKKRRALNLLGNSPRKEKNTQNELMDLD
jgi:hypothetical protein